MNGYGVKITECSRQLMTIATSQLFFVEMKKILNGKVEMSKGEFIVDFKDKKITLIMPRDQDRYEDMILQNAIFNYFCIKRKNVFGQFEIEDYIYIDRTNITDSKRQHTLLDTLMKYSWDHFKIDKKDIAVISCIKYSYEKIRIAKLTGSRYELIEHKYLLNPKEAKVYKAMLKKCLDKKNISGHLRWKLFSIRYIYEYKFD